MDSFTTTITYVTKTCKTCGVEYALSNAFNDALHKSGAWWYCPNGHQWHYTETNEMRLRKELQEVRDAHVRTQRCLNSSNERADKATRSASAFKGHLTRTKNRVKHGVCPCCTRTFEDLYRHMASEHPNYATVDEE